MFGGRGKLTGVFCALVLVATLRNVLGLSQIGGDAQGIAIGLLLILAAPAQQRGRALPRRPQRFPARPETRPGPLPTKHQTPGRSTP